MNRIILGNIVHEIGHNFGLNHHEPKEGNIRCIMDCVGAEEQFFAAITAEPTDCNNIYCDECRIVFQMKRHFVSKMN